VRVTLTGGTGFVGAHTVKALLDAGHEPRLLVRSRERLAANVAPLGVEVSSLDVVMGDMTDERSVKEAVEGADAVIHAAAVVAALDKHSAARTVEVNVRGTQIVVDAALRAGCDPVVHVSSVAALFDPRQPVVHSDLPPATEAASPYTRSKALAEQWVRERQAEQAPVTIVYPGGVLGPAAGDAVGDVAEGIVSMLKSGFVALDDGAVGVIDVRDVAAVLIATLQPGLGPRRFMAGGRLVTLSEIGALLRAVTGRRMPVLPTPGAVFRGLGHVVDALRRIVPLDTVFSAEAMDLLTLARPTDDRLVQDVLQVHYRDPHETFDVAVRDLYRLGRVNARQAGPLVAPRP
jgi:nucleoside-diphosphate-sugar epimerase